jgi:hypothetical protein
VVVKTESYDYARGLLNRLASFIGMRLQRYVWIVYFKNIRRTYQTKGILRNGHLMKDELQERERLKAGIACQQTWLGSKECPWVPERPYPGKEIP